MIYKLLCHPFVMQICDFRIRKTNLPLYQYITPIQHRSSIHKESKEEKIDIFTPKSCMKRNKNILLGKEKETNPKLQF